MQLKVVKLDQAAWEPTWQAPVTVVTTDTIIPLQEGKTLECPNVQEARKMADGQPRVRWYHVRTDRTVRLSVPSVCVCLALCLTRLCCLLRSGTPTGSRKEPVFSSTP